jgi:hypothetical protein
VVVIDVVVIDVVVIDVVVIDVVVIDVVVIYGGVESQPSVKGLLSSYLIQYNSLPAPNDRGLVAGTKPRAGEELYIARKVNACELAACTRKKTVCIAMLAWT